jgi:hypothetical protein
MKKNTTTPTTTTTTKTRKNTPKVTNVQKRMTPEQQTAWFNEHCAKLDAETQAIIKGKLAAPLTVRGAKKVKDEGYSAFTPEYLAGLTLMQALSVKTVLAMNAKLIDANIASRDSEKEAARAALKEQMAALEAVAVALA